jgi:hypothetical protein
MTTVPPIIRVVRQTDYSLCGLLSAASYWAGSNYTATPKGILAPIIFGTATIITLYLYDRTKTAILTRGRGEGT